VGVRIQIILATTVAPTNTDQLTAWSTFAAAVVALLLGLGFFEWLRHWFWRPKFTVSLRLEPPDCHIIEKIAQVSLGSNIPLPINIPPSFPYRSFYCRLSITNVGGRRANDVEVRMTGLFTQDAAGAPTRDSDFLPMNLTWSHRNTLLLPALYRDLPSHCDLCHFDHLSGSALMEFDTEVTPNQVGPERWPTKKPPGKYRTQIAVVADNASPSYHNVDIEFTGQWYDDPIEMAQRGLRVTLA
jgi:hypothetical protein